MNIFGRGKKYLQSLICSFNRADNQSKLTPELSISDLPGPFTAAYALGKYSLGTNHKKTDLGQLIHNLKYHYSMEAAEILGDFVIRFLPHLPTKIRPDLLITIPDSIINRPFSPVPFIAQRVGAHFNWQVIDDAIMSTRFRRPQY